jgi:hypothetical protein
VSYRCEVSVLNAAAPALFSVSTTCHWLEVVDSSAVALLTWVPGTFATSSAYLPHWPPLSPQATTWTFGLL